MPTIAIRFSSRSWKPWSTTTTGCMKWRIKIRPMYSTVHLQHCMNLEVSLVTRVYRLRGKGVGYQLSDGEMLQTNKYQDYLIKCLLSLSATQEQSIKAYYNILPDLVPLRSTISMEIAKDNWREHLGNSRLGTSSRILFSTLALLIVEYMQFLCSVSCILCSSDS